MFLEIKGDNYEVNILNINDLDKDLIDQWKNLEYRAIEGNAYLSPNFILPVIHHLSIKLEIIFIFVSRISVDYKILTGVGVFEESKGSKQFPFPHLKAFSSIHSYLSGLLIDEEFIDPTLVALFMFFKKNKKNCYGVEFIKKTGDTLLAKRINNITSQMFIPWHEYNRKKRAILIPNKLSDDYIDSLFSTRMKKNMRYCRNYLTKTGEIDWRFISGQEVNKDCVDRFLQLEHMGWKSSEGSSLLSNSKHEAFFRDMVDGFAKNDQVFFTELVVGGRSIASTVNLLSAKAGFAFKIGWDPEFTAASPGFMNEVEFIRSAAELLPSIEYIDSGAEEGSFIEKLWKDNYSLVSGVFVMKKLAVPIVYLIKFYRSIKKNYNKPNDK